MKNISYFMFFSLIAVSGCSFQNNNEVKDNGIWVQLGYGQSIDGYTRSGNLIYGGYLDSLVYYTPMSDVDVQTFKVCKGSGYAKDNKRVYYPLMVTCVEGKNYGGCYFEKYVVQKAKPETFKYLKDGYAIDRNQLFYKGEKIKYKNSIIKDLLEEK